MSKCGAVLWSGRITANAVKLGDWLSKERTCLSKVSPLDGLREQKSVLVHRPWGSPCHK